MDSERTDFGDINGNDNDGNTLMNEMITGTGFKPIGDYTTTKNNNIINILHIVFAFIHMPSHITSNSCFDYSIAFFSFPLFR